MNHFDDSESGGSALKRIERAKQVAKIRERVCVCVRVSVRERECVWWRVRASVCAVSRVQDGEAISRGESRKSEIQEVVSGNPKSQRKGQGVERANGH
jgi:hypothetical protein